MRLVHINTGFTIVEYQREKTLFYDRFLAKQMRVEGVRIPPYLREQFGGKRTIRYGDDAFQRAFSEVYAPSAFKSPLYQWCTEK